MNVSIQSVNLKLKGKEEMPEYKISGYVKNGRVDLRIYNKDEEIGKVYGELGFTGNFSVVAKIYNSKYERISIGAEVENGIITRGGISINEASSSYYNLEGIVGEQIKVNICSFSEEGVYLMVAEGKMKLET